MNSSTLSRVSTKISNAGPSGFTQHNGLTFTKTFANKPAKGSPNLRKDLMADFKTGASQLGTKSFSEALDKDGFAGKRTTSQSKRKISV